MQNKPQVVVAFMWEQTDLLLNLLAMCKTEEARTIYDQIEQSQAQAIDNEEEESES